MTLLKIDLLNFGIFLKIQNLKNYYVTQILREIFLINKKILKTKQKKFYVFKNITQGLITL